MDKLKNDEDLGSGILMSEQIAKTIKDDLMKYPFHDYFHKNAVLVPIPSSSLSRKDALWVPKCITLAMEKYGLGTSKTLLKRDTPLPRSSTSSARNRPKAREHYNSMIVQKTLDEIEEIVLVDDVITRGATVLGAANLLANTFPDARIRVFAAMRTVSNPGEFDKTLDPRSGNVSLRGEGTLRRP